jgi:imidazolonepropionase-like amidohydrolase
MSETPLVRPVLLAALLALAPAAGAAPGTDAPPKRPAPVAVRVGHLFTGTEVHTPGVVTLSGGKVASVGKDVPVGAGALDFPEAWATPGWIDAASTTGLAGADSEMTRETTPCVRPLRVFDPSAPEVRRALAAGVTSIFLEPGNANVVGGVASVVKTTPAAGGGPRVVKEEAALKIAFGQDPCMGNFPAHGIPQSIYARRPTTRMGVLAVLRDAWILGRAAGPDSPDPDMAAMARAAAGGIPVRALARTVQDLRTALRMKADLGFEPVLEGVSEGYMVADLLSAAKAGCVVGPLVYPVGGRGPEWTDPALDNAGALHRAGVRIALTAGGRAAGLRDQAAMAVRFGLPRDAALRAVTSAAAALSGAADRIGTLEKGRDADLVLWDGDPLEPSSRVLEVIVDGEVVFEAEARK